MTIGSHCSDSTCSWACSATEGFTSKTIWVGSQGGLTAAGRGECDLAGIHLLEPRTDDIQRGRLCRPGSDVRARLRPDARGCLPPGDHRFEGLGVAEAVASALSRSGVNFLVDDGGAGRAF